MSSSNKDSFTSSFSVWIPFLFLVWLMWVGLPILCWIKADKNRRAILVLSLISEKMLSDFHCWVLCWLWVVICDLYYVEVCSLYTNFFKNHKWILNYVASIFCIYWDEYIYDFCSSINQCGVSYWFVSLC